MAKSKKKDERILYAFLATFLSIVGFIIDIFAKHDDKYVMFYAKQSLVIFLIAIVAGIISWIFSWIPIIGWLINFALTIVVIAFWILSWAYSLSGRKKEIPFVEIFSNKIKL